MAAKPDNTLLVLIVLGAGAYLIWSSRPRVTPLISTTPIFPTREGERSANATNPVTQIVGGVADVISRIFSRQTAPGNIVMTPPISAGPIGPSAPSTGYYPPMSAPFDWSTLPQPLPMRDFVIQSPQDWWTTSGGQLEVPEVGVGIVDWSRFGFGGLTPEQAFGGGPPVSTLPVERPRSRIYITGLE